MVQAHEWEELTLVLEAAEDACQVVAATAVDQQSGFGSDEQEVHLELVGTWYGLEHILRLHGLVVRETDQDSSPVEDLRDQWMLDDQRVGGRQGQLDQVEEEYVDQVGLEEAFP